MTTDIQLSEFDYAALDAETRIVIKQKTDELNKLLRDAAQNIFDIGGKLAEVRDRLRHNREDSFERWLAAEFGMSRRTAYNFINVYERFANRANFAQLDIAASALYLLAAPSVSDEVREEALQRAEQGEAITHKAAKQLVEAAAPIPDWVAVHDLKTRILALLTAREGGLRYDELRDQLAIRAPQDKVNLRTALDGLFGDRCIVKNGAVYALPEPPTETSQDAARLLRFLGEMGETTFKPLRDRAGLENSRFWRAFNLLEADGKIVHHPSKGGFPIISLIPAPAARTAPDETARRAQEPEPTPAEVVPPAAPPAPETPVSDAPPEPAPIIDRAAILQRDRAQAAAAEAQNSAAWQTAQTRVKLEKALCDVVDGLAAASQVQGIRSFAEVFSAEEMIATRNLILNALVAFDKTRFHLEKLAGRLDTMIETGKPYEE